ncbi:MAG: mevalonate kinase, partial [Bacteroidia bacterium]
MIKTVSYPRAALIGNPSDGYFGKTIAFTFSNFKVEVTLHESDKLEIIPGNRDRMIFDTIDELVGEVKQNGYYGGIRLIKAAIKKLHDYSTENNIKLPEKNFTIGFLSTIPDRLGLAGSSAIVTASVKAMMQFYEIEIPKPVLANLILSIEKDELKIGAGLQDRVAQVYNCPIYMNFDNALMNKQGFGEYIPFDKNLLPSLYIAYRTNLSEGSEITHNDFAARYVEKEPAVLNAISQWAELTNDVWNKLQSGDKNIAALLIRNFEIRNGVMNISKGNLELVNTAQSVGASAKFTGSGGAIIGTYTDEKMF